MAFQSTAPACARVRLRSSDPEPFCCTGISRPRKRFPIPHDSSGRASLWHYLLDFPGYEPVSAAARRPLKTRERRWAHSLARRLAAAGVRPNQVSTSSVVFAGSAGVCLALSGASGEAAGPVLLLAAAGFVQLRLLSNLIDGLLAVEGGLGSPAGEIWNDLPDRIADPFLHSLTRARSARWRAQKRVPLRSVSASVLENHMTQRGSSQCERP